MFRPALPLRACPLGVILLTSSLLLNIGCTNSDTTTPTDVDASLRAALADFGVTVLDPGPDFTTDQVELGRRLFFDKILSGNKDISCATCHHPSAATGDALPVSIGTGGHGTASARIKPDGDLFIPRNAPEVFNRRSPEWRSMFWDSRIGGSLTTGFHSPAGSKLPAGFEHVLDIQAMFPVTSRDEMRGSLGDLDVNGAPNELAALEDSDLTGIWGALMARLMAIPEYRDRFAAAFPGTAVDDMGFEFAARAIGAFEAEAYTFTNSPFDRYLAGNNAALSTTAKAGARLFYGEANCATCHTGNLLTDQKHHNIAVPQVGDGKGAESPEDFGRMRETGLEEDRCAFRTPPLRNVEISGPYMHDGAYMTLEGAIRHHLNPDAALREYDKTQLPLPFRGKVLEDSTFIDNILAARSPLLALPIDLTEEQVAQLAAFLRALTDDAARDLSGDFPPDVPSGLPLED